MIIGDKQAVFSMQIQLLAVFSLFCLSLHKTLTSVTALLLGNDLRANIPYNLIVRHFAQCILGVTDGFTKSIRNTCNCFLKAVGVYFQGILCSAVTWRHFCNWISDSSPFDDSILCYSVANYMLNMSYLCNVQRYSISTCQFCFNICGLFDRVPFKGW